MFTARKKLQKKEGEAVSELETQVAQALFDLEAGSAELKNELKDLQITSAREVELKGDKKGAIVLFVPYGQRIQFRRIQSRLVRELEKKFSGKPVVLIIQRRIIRKPPKQSRKALVYRPVSRSVAAVHKAILDDLVYPAEVVGKRIRYRVDGSSVLKMYVSTLRHTLFYTLPTLPHPRVPPHHSITPPSRVPYPCTLPHPPPPCPYPRTLCYRAHSSRLIIISNSHLDPKDKQNIEYKLDTFASVYKKITGKTAVFEFPVVSHEN